MGIAGSKGGEKRRLFIAASFSHAQGNTISDFCRCVVNIAGSTCSGETTNCCGASSLMVLNADVIVTAAASMAGMPPNKMILYIGYPFEVAPTVSV